MNVSEHRRGDGISSHLCSYCCQPWPCPAVADALAAVERVRGVADELHEFSDRQWPSTREALDYFDDRLRRAVDGPT